MRRMTQLAGAALAVTLAAAPAGWAEVLELTPSRAAVLRDDGTDSVKVALVFNLGDFPQGEGQLHIASATLEWPLAGMATDRLTEYTLHPVTAAWGSGQDVAVSFAQEPVEQWDFTPADHEAIRGGLVRFQLRGLVENWLAGKAQNHGVVIATPDLGRETLTDQLGKVKLTILYGFVR